MLGYAVVRTREKSDPKKGVVGDIVQILPVMEIGTKALNNNCVILMDLNIPCEEDFQNLNYRFLCKTCPNNHFELCDTKKYGSPIFTEGDLFHMPKVDIKHRFKINISSIFSQDTFSLFEVQEKTEAQRALMYTNANNNEQSSILIIDKEDI
jgi:hypothetical protein